MTNEPNETVSGEPAMGAAQESSIAQAAASVVAQAAAQPGAQITFNAVVSQAMNPNAWTAQNLAALIAGIARQNEIQHTQWNTLGRARAAAVVGRTDCDPRHHGRWGMAQGHRAGVGAHADDRRGKLLLRLPRRQGTRPRKLSGGAWITEASTMTCVYCGGNGDSTREHVFPAWVRGLISGYSPSVPSRVKHPWGGESVVTDVCASCNNGPLSRLDEGARGWWEGTLAGSRSLNARAAEALAKWAVKVAYNSQRAARVGGGLGSEPPFPTAAGPWVVGQTDSCASVAVCAAFIPAAGRSADVPAGIYSFGEAGWACRYIVFPAAVLFVAWDSPTGTATQSADWLCANAPAVRLDGVAAETALPDLSNPAVLHRGLYRRMGQ